LALIVVFLIVCLGCCCGSKKYDQKPEVIIPKLNLEDVGVNSKE
jgi:hypothetical protein